MRLTLRTNLAMRALMFCAVNTGRLVRKTEIAEACNASANHLGVVINQLAQAGFLVTARGRHGGLKLARPADQIAVGDVFRLLESGAPSATCFADVDGTCPLSKCCRLRTALARAVDAFYDELDRVTLHDLVEDNVGLETLLTLETA